MKFVIITHVVHGAENNSFYAYSPYVNEMNIWEKYVDELVIVAPLNLNDRAVIDSNYLHKKIKFVKVKSFRFKTFLDVLKTVYILPITIFAIYKSMKTADHIHLRCPGNIGLLGCIVQILFPNKIKTAKYAGNWDSNSKQPISYKLQKWILSNTFLTRNIQVLVYGEWQNQSRNIKPFFTATYSENEKFEIETKKLNSIINFVFVGTLAAGKNPLFALQLIEKLKENNTINLDIYGEGIERSKLEDYIKEKKLQTVVKLHGNQNKEVLKKAYIDSHFVVLPSKSEGWPKAVAEAMFWGCLPISSAVSCVPNMLDFGNRGIILEMNLEKDVLQIHNLLKNEKKYQEKVQKAITWSRNFTTNLFESEIKKIVEKK